MEIETSYLAPHALGREPSAYLAGAVENVQKHRLVYSSSGSDCTRTHVQSRYK